MSHIQNATLAGGVAIGAIADQVTAPFASMILGTFAGIVSTLGFQYITPYLNKHLYLHDTCGVNNLHGIPGILSGISSFFVAISARRQEFNGDRLYVFYPSRIPRINSTEYFEFNLQNSSDVNLREGGLGRSGLDQGGYQLAVLFLTLLLACVGGLITGFLIRIPAIFFQWNDKEEYFNDKINWIVPQINEHGCYGNRNFKSDENNQQTNQQITINESTTRL